MRAPAARLQRRGCASDTVPFYISWWLDNFTRADEAGRNASEAAKRRCPSQLWPRTLSWTNASAHAQAEEDGGYASEGADSAITKSGSASPPPPLGGAGTRSERLDGKEFFRRCVGVFLRLRLRGAGRREHAQ